MVEMINSKMNKMDKIVFLGLAVAFLVVVAALIYVGNVENRTLKGAVVPEHPKIERQHRFFDFNTGSRAVITGDAVLVGIDSGETASGTLGLVKKHVPLELSDDDIKFSGRWRK